MEKLHDTENGVSIVMYDFTRRKNNVRRTVISYVLEIALKLNFSKLILF